MYLRGDFLDSRQEFILAKYRRGENNARWNFPAEKFLRGKLSGGKIFLGKITAHELREYVGATQKIPLIFII